MSDPHFPELIGRFNTVAGPYLSYFPAASCIEQSRILLEVLRALDVRSEAIETAMKVHCRELNLAYVTGADAEGRARGKAAAGFWIDRTTPEAEGYGHVVVAAAIDGGTFLIDPTIGQASIPDRGLIIPRVVMPVGPLEQWPTPGCEITAGMDLDDGKLIEVTWLIRDTRHFESTEAWEPSHLWALIGRLVREMKWATTVEERIARGGAAS
jgi:hypothetical protein